MTQLRYYMPAIALAGAGCLSSFQTPARGDFHGHAIASTVDHESARYFLEEYAAGTGQSSPRYARIKALEARMKGLPNREDLQQISREFSLDFAALFFADRLMKEGANVQLQKQFLANAQRVRAGVPLPSRELLILMVPGYDYAENGPVTGADLAKPMALIQKAGYDVQFVQIDPLGSVEENAAVLKSYILKNQNRTIVVVGPSSAGPAIHLVLGRLLAAGETSNIAAWLNLGGILQGSPLLDQFSTGPKGLLFSAILWFKGWRRESFESMNAAVSRRRFATLRVPAHIAIYNYIGLSLSGSISKFGRDKYWLMREDGPNDGLTLLPDMIAPNSHSILSPGTDHFFAEDPDIDLKTLALLVTIVERLPR